MVRTVPNAEPTVIRRIFRACIRVADKRGPVTAKMIVQELPPMDGTPVEALPSGLLGRAVTVRAVQPARASRVLSGLLAADGGLLIVTITSEDLDWSRQIWLSIRHHVDGLPLRRGQQVRTAKQRRRH